MTSNLISIITQVLGPTVVARIASKLGIDEAQASSAIQAGVPGLLAMLTSLVSKPGGASALFKAVSNQDPRQFSDLANTLGGPGQSALGDSGASTLTSLLGSSTFSALTNAVAQYAGLGAGASKSIIGSLSPAVLGVLGQQMRERGLDAASLGGLLAAQKDNIARALPADLAAHLGDAGLLDSDRPKAARFEPLHVTPLPTSANLGWVLPALAIMALGGLAWYLLSSPAKQVATLPSAAIEAPDRAIRLTADEAKTWISKPVYSSDDKRIGEIIEVSRGPDNKVTEVFIDTGSFLGIGANRYQITSEKIRESKPDGVWLTVRESEVADAVKEGAKSAQ